MPFKKKIWNIFAHTANNFLSIRKLIHLCVAQNVSQKSCFRVLGLENFRKHLTANRPFFFFAHVRSPRIHSQCSWVLSHKFYFHFLLGKRLVSGSRQHRVSWATMTAVCLTFFWKRTPIEMNHLDARERHCVRIGSVEKQRKSRVKKKFPHHHLSAVGSNNNFICFIYNIFYTVS